MSVRPSAASERRSRPGLAPSAETSRLATRGPNRPQCHGPPLESWMRPLSNRRRISLRTERSTLQRIRAPCIPIFGVGECDQRSDSAEFPTPKATKSLHFQIFRNVSGNVSACRRSLRRWFLRMSKWPPIEPSLCMRLPFAVLMIFRPWSSQTVDIQGVS